MFRISIVDPKRMIEVGSFRVDSHGNQARYEVFLLVESEACLFHCTGIIRQNRMYN